MSLVFLAGFNFLGGHRGVLLVFLFSFSRNAWAVGDAEIRIWRIVWTSEYED
jgi:hypothetical protein